MAVSDRLAHRLNEAEDWIREIHKAEYRYGYEVSSVDKGQKDYYCTAIIMLPWISRGSI